MIIRTPPNLHFHAYSQMDATVLFVSGYVLTVQKGDVVDTIIGPFRDEDDAGLLALKLCEEAPEKEIHLWPLCGLTEMKELLNGK